MVRIRNGFGGAVLVLLVFLLFVGPAWGQQSELTVVKEAPLQVTTGQNFTYTIIVENTGTEPAVGVVVTDQLPPGVTLNGALQEGCDSSGTGQITVTCTIEEVPGGEEPIEIDLNVRAPGSPTTLLNDASAQEGDNEPVLSNETPTAVVPAPTPPPPPPPPEPDLSIDKDADPDPVEVGEELTYTIEVENEGEDVQNVVVRDRLPANVDIEDVDTDPGADCNQVGRTITSTFDEIEENEIVEVTIVVVPEDEGEIRNRAAVFVEGTEDAIDRTFIDTDVVDDGDDGNNDDDNDGIDNDDDLDDDNDGILDINDNDDDNDGILDTEEDLADAESDLNDEITDGELTDGQFDDDGDDDGPAVSAEAGDGVAEASTPNAVASAGDDPDELTPIEEPLGDVEDEIPTSGPLPNTGGMPLVYWLLPLAGLLMLAGLPIYKWAKRRE